MTLKKLRTARNMTGAAFARLIGASPGELHDWENGRRLPTVERAREIETALGVTGLVEAVVEQRLMRAAA